MKKLIYIASVLAMILVVGAFFRFFLFSVTPTNASKMPIENHPEVPDVSTQGSGTIIGLPPPNTKGGMPLGRALSLRRSVRRYEALPLSLSELSQLLWSGQGVTHPSGFRTAPSAGATFPLDLFVVVNQVSGLSKGLYQYLHHSHKLLLVRNKIDIGMLAKACLGQRMVSEAGAVIVFSAVFERTTRRYGERGERYVHNEVGHASQNIHLMAASLNLGTVVIGAYRDNEVEELLDLGKGVRVLYLMPVGKIKSQ